MKAARSLIAVAALLAAGGCSLAPEYHAPAIEAPAQYKEAAPWTDAQPADAQRRGAWWTVFGDAKLSALEEKLDAGNPDLAAAYSHYSESKSYEDQARSGLFPTLSGILDWSRDRQSDTRPLRGGGQPNEYGADTLGVQADYELDLWGRVHNSLVAAKSETQAAAADLASARLSLEVRLADDYMAIVGEDRDIQLLNDSVAAYGKALELTQTLHGGGIVSGLDVSRAQAQLSAARAQVSESRARRALLEHAIAALVGEPAPSFTLAPDAHEIALPDIPASVPAELLQRRPDIAAAERRTAAANAGIGIARAAFYPSLDLSASFGVQSSSTGSWLAAPSAYWAVGPMLAQTIFDAGKHRAQLTRAKESLDEAAARYRATVLAAFQQVEDNLALLQNYQAETVDQQAAVKAAEQSLNLSMTQYRDGGIDYLNVVDSQTAALTAQRLALNLQTRRLQAGVDLVRALGGGWTLTQQN